MCNLVQANLNQNLIVLTMTYLLEIPVIDIVERSGAHDRNLPFHVCSKKKKKKNCALSLVDNGCKYSAHFVGIEHHQVV